MNVLESRPGRPLRLRPWVLLVGAAVVVAVVVLVFTVGASSPAPSGSKATEHRCLEVRLRLRRLRPQRASI